jgi:hypothetical protein
MFNSTNPFRLHDRRPAHDRRRLAHDHHHLARVRRRDLFPIPALVRPCRVRLRQFLPVPAFDRPRTGLIHVPCLPLYL